LSANSDWISLEDDALHLWEKKGMQGWIRAYEDNMADEKKTLLKWKVPKNMSPKERSRIMGNFEKDLRNDIRNLPESSQNYYLRSFAPFYSIRKNLATTAVAFFRSLIVNLIPASYGPSHRRHFHRFFVSILI
jgi:hypothetical protein